MILEGGIILSAGDFGRWYNFCLLVILEGNIILSVVCLAKTVWLFLRVIFKRI